MTVSLGAIEIHKNQVVIKKKSYSAHLGSTYTKIGMIQRRLAWPLRKDDMQIPEAFHIFVQHLLA